jgi:hypothetical protein
MRGLLIAASALVVTGMSAGDTLNNREISELKRIYASLYGTQYLSRPWEQLKPYLRDTHAMEAPIICSASCGGIIPLRGGLFINAIFINPQKLGKPWGPQDGLIYLITLNDGKKIFFRRGKEPET